MSYDFWQGEKVRLRAVEPKDAEALMEWNKDSEAARHSHNITFPDSYERVKEMCEKEAKKKPEKDEFDWVAEDHNGNIVGSIDTFFCNRKNGTFWYGLALLRPYWGQGYAKDMIKLVLKYYFYELGYQKVNAGAYAFNNRSIKMHEKFGFVREGLMRSMVYTNGKNYDEVVFGMLREEFEQRYPISPLPE